MSSRPAVAIIANAQAPYRLHLHLRIAREIPGIRLLSVFTHEKSNAPWRFTAPPEIGPMLFGEGESTEHQAALTGVFREWRRGGRIIELLKTEAVRAVVMLGYNDAGRLRIMRWCHKNHVACFLWGDSNIRGDRARGIKAIAKRLVVGKVIRWCDGILACGTLGRDYFMKYGAASDRIYYFPVEPDYDLIRDVDERETRERFKLSRDRRRLIYCGRLIQIKRVDLLIGAFARIADARPDWDLLIVGDGEMRSTLEANVPARLRDRLRWTGFIDDQPTIAALYRCCDVCVVPSDFEPWGLVINEAVAAGLAVISSDVVGAAAELVRDGVNGRVFVADDINGLTTALLDVTDVKNLARYKSAASTVLADWRHRGDPVEGLSKALRSAGVL